MNHSNSQNDTALLSRLLAVRPTSRQLQHQQMEFYGFIHFTVNTFTGKEWGDGSESPALFQPARLNTKQWVQTAKAAGMTGLILTCKHHDGFCLWPSACTEHSVKHAPWRDGHGDVVRETADACRAAGLKFGIYLSPWDRNSTLYGQSDAYNDYFIAQLTELLTGYGEIFTVWFDGACGEDANGRRQHYDWPRFYETIRRLQPDACIAVCGPDVRWCGNESGDTRPSEWSVVPRRLSWAETVEGKSQNADTSDFRRQKLKSQDLDLGSRDVLADETDLIWYPAEVNTSIRPGWFYHAEEDSQVRSLQELQQLYLHSVGGNATFLLNLPPTPEGLIAAPDAAVMQAFGDWLRQSFSAELAGQRTTEMKADGLPTFTLCWDHPQQLHYLVLREDIAQSQRVEAFRVQIYDAAGMPVYTADGTVIGYQKIVPLPSLEEALNPQAAGVTGCRIEVEVLQSRGEVFLSRIQAF